MCGWRSWRRIAHSTRRSRSASFLSSALPSALSTFAATGVPRHRALKMFPNAPAPIFSISSTSSQDACVASIASSVPPATESSRVALGIPL